MRHEIKENGTIECYFNHSPHPFWISAELAEQLGGAEGIEEALFGKNRINFRFFPRNSSLQYPYRPIDWDLMLRNHEEKARKWRYVRNWLSGNMLYYGYGFKTPDGFQFWNWEKDRPSGSPIRGRLF